MSELYEDLFQKFKQLWANDPIMKSAMRGEIMWGDLDLYCEEIAVWEKESESRSPSPLLEEEVEEVEEEPTKPERIVPEFTPGIKTIITRNLPRDITVEMLRTAFEKYGPIKDIYIPKNMDKNSPYFGTVKGFALIKFLKADNSATAYKEEYGRLIFGKNNITVEFAKEDR